MGEDEMSNIVVLVGSVRKHGNTELLAQSFVEGAKEKNQVTVISVADYKVNPCIGCNACFSTENHRCVQQDDMELVYDKLKDADLVAVASPVYFYGISAQLKALVDRLHNPIRDEFHIKKLALLLVGAATIPELFDAIRYQYQMVLKFFNMKDAGMILVPGVKEIGDIKGHPALQEAYALGASIE